MSRGARGLLVVGILATAAVPAGAEPGRYENDRWTRIGVEGGAIRSGTSVGLGAASVAYGRRVGGTHLAGEYALGHGWSGDAGEPAQALGFGHRLSLALEWPVTFARVEDGSMEIAFWLEGGAGGHRLPGAEAWRPHLFVGWAAEYRRYRDRGDYDAGGTGFWLSGRVLVADPDPAVAPRAIAAGGAVPRGADRFAVGFIGSFAWRWGR